eukprot:Lithocolla_globosa_v1_NODE_76_length_6846_cov_31.756737.p1 type:complete len:1128 gc:universal NODE_76_length_6846_cov_31.756737:3812-429(-)
MHFRVANEFVDGLEIYSGGRAMAGVLDTYMLDVDHPAQVVIKVLKGPKDIYDYTIPFQLVSACEWDGAGDGMTQGIGFQLDVDVHFLPPCFIPVWNDNFIPLPYGNLLDTSIFLSLTLDDWRNRLAGSNKVTKATVFYRKKGESNWIFVDDISPLDDTVEYTWDVLATAGDAIYEVFVRSVCEQNVAESVPQSFILEYTELEVFGHPQPHRQILLPGQEVSVIHNKDLDCNRVLVTITNNVTMTTISDTDYQIKCKENSWSVFLFPETFDALRGSTLVFTTLVFSVYGNKKNDEFVIKLSCPNDFYEDGFDNGCFPCPEFYTSPPGSTSVGQCICDGNVENARCSDCFADEWSDSIKHCQPCPELSHSPEGNGDIRGCICEPGSVGIITQLGDECSLCPHSTFSRQARCDGCPPTAYSPVGSDDLSDCTCPNGSLLNIMSETCDLCSANTYHDRPSETCIASPTTDFQSPKGSFGFDSCLCDGCNPCSTAEYRDHVSGVCLSCPENSFSSGGERPFYISSCMCEEGYYVPGGPPYSGLACEPCPYGSFDNGDACLECPEFSHTINNASTSRSDCICDMNYYPLGDSCVHCSIDTSPKPIHPNCVTTTPPTTTLPPTLCPSGFRWDGDECKQCNDDQYSNFDTSLCLECPKDFKVSKELNPGDITSCQCEGGKSSGLASFHTLGFPRCTSQQLFIAMVLPNVKYDWYSMGVNWQILDQAIINSIETFPFPRGNHDVYVQDVGYWPPSGGVVIRLRSYQPGENDLNRYDEMVEYFEAFLKDGAFEVMSSSSYFQPLQNLPNVALVDPSSTTFTGVKNDWVLVERRGNADSDQFYCNSLQAEISQQQSMIINQEDSLSWNLTTTTNFMAESFLAGHLEKAIYSYRFLPQIKDYSSSKWTILSDQAHVPPSFFGRAFQLSTLLSWSPPPAYIRDGEYEIRLELFCHGEAVVTVTQIILVDRTPVVVMGPPDFSHGEETSEVQDVLNPGQPASFTVEFNKQIDCEFFHHYSQVEIVQNTGANKNINLRCSGSTITLAFLVDETEPADQQLTVTFDLVRDISGNVLRIQQWVLSPWPSSGQTNVKRGMIDFHEQELQSQSSNLFMGAMFSLQVITVAAIIVWKRQKNLVKSQI